VKSVRVTANTVRVHALALEEFLREFDDAVLPTLVQMLMVAHELLEFTEEKNAVDVLPFDELALEDVDEALESLYWLFRGSYSKDDEDGIDAPEICVDCDKAVISLKRKPARSRRPATAPTSGVAKVRVELYRGAPSAN
jgi:hypothetical protein